MHKILSSVLIASMVSVIVTLPVEALAKGRWNAGPGPYKPAPSASYPSASSIDASNPVTELAPARRRPIDQITEETPVDPLDDSETPAGPVDGAGQPSQQEDLVKAPTVPAEEPPAAVAEKGDEVVVEKDAVEIVGTIVREEGRRESFQPVERVELASAAPSLGGGCSLVR
jgi:hypothetical protein